MKRGERWHWVLEGPGGEARVVVHDDETMPARVLEVTGPPELIARLGPPIEEALEASVDASGPTKRQASSARSRGASIRSIASRSADTVTVRRARSASRARADLPGATARYGHA